MPETRLPGRDESVRPADREYVTDPSLVRHMLGVEAAMRAYARKFGEDEELWGQVGLLHDFDYQRWPDPPDHPLQGARSCANAATPRS